MPTEADQYAERARQQSEAFMQSARQQMLQHSQEQRSMAVGQAPGMGPAQMPQAGTPAGRLMETINSLVRQGAAFGSGAVSSVGQGIGRIGQAAGAGLGFMMGGAAYGAGGIQGGGIYPGTQQQGLMGNLFTAYGGGLPLGLGKYAGQRMDMTQTQAQTLAREELGYRAAGGVRGAAYDVVSGATLGMFGAAMRREGREFETRDLQYFSRQAQQRLRFMRTADVDRMDPESGGRGAFTTGIDSDLATDIGRAEARAFSPFQAEMGLSREQVQNMANRTARVIGGRGMARMYAQRGVQGGAAEMARQGGFQREVQQTLHLTEEEMENFVRTRGEIMGSWENLARIARTSNQIAGRMGMAPAQVNQALTGFGMTGMQMGTGQAGTMAALGGQLQRLSGVQEMGGMSREELFRYGGTSASEALQRQTMVRMQQNLAMWQRGGLGGFGTMATQDRGAYEQFIGGQQTFMQSAGAVGAMMVRDPLARMRAQQDPEQYRRMMTMGARTAFTAVQGMQRGGMFSMFGDPADQRTLAVNRFREMTGLETLEAGERYSQFEREGEMFRYLASDNKGFAGKTEHHAQQIQGLYNKFLAQNRTDVLLMATGATSEQEGAAIIYSRMTRNGAVDLDPNMSLEQTLAYGAASGGTPEATARIVAGQVGGLSSELQGLEEQEGILYTMGETQASFGGRKKFWEKDLPRYARRLMQSGVSREVAARAILGQDARFAVGTGEDEVIETLTLTDEGKLARRDPNTGKVQAFGSYGDVLKRYGAPSQGTIYKKWRDPLTGIMQRLTTSAKSSDDVARTLVESGIQARDTDLLRVFQDADFRDKMSNVLPGLEGGPEGEGRGRWFATQLAEADRADMWSKMFPSAAGNMSEVGRLVRGSSRARAFSTAMMTHGTPGAGVVGWSEKFRGEGEKARQARERQVHLFVGARSSGEFNEKMALLFQKANIPQMTVGGKPVSWDSETFAQFRKEKGDEYAKVLQDSGLITELGANLLNEHEKVRKPQLGGDAANAMYVRLTSDAEIRAASLNAANAGGA